MRSRSRLLLALGVIVGLLVLSGCSSNAPLDTLDPAGRKSQSIDDLFMFVFYLATVIFFGVFGALGYIAWKYRVRKPGPDDVHYAGDYADEVFPHQTHGNTKLEIGWTIAPTVLMIIIAIVSLTTLVHLDNVDAAPSDSEYPDLEVLVVGQQWWWEYQYYLHGAVVDGVAQEPDFVTAGEMVIPVGQDVQFYTTSRDVIHSFWIPRLNGKKDAAPGRVHPWVIQANEIGRFAGSCTEFCGLSHAYMRMYAVAVSLDDFSAWVANQTTVRTPLTEDDPNYAGEQLFINNCQRCHVIDGVSQRDRGDGTVVADDMSLYGTIEDYRDYSDGTFTQGKYAGGVNLVSQAAPNLTHFADRTSYAGSFFDLYPDAQAVSEAGDYLSFGDGTHAYDRPTLEAWLRNPPAAKPNAAGEARGMPNLNLSEADIDLLVEYLMSLD